MNVTKNLLLAIMCCICSVAHAGGELPDRSMTPGAINEALTPSQYLAQCHTKGWTRELWIKALGMKAVLPPPQEVRDVKTAIGAARAQQSRTDML